jgi:hypothetical protein
MPPNGAAAMAASAFRIDGVMRVQGGHWLDHDSTALAVLIIGISVVMLLALSIWYGFNSALRPAHTHSPISRVSHLQRAASIARQ